MKSRISSFSKAKYFGVALAIFSLMPFQIRAATVGFDIVLNYNNTPNLLEQAAFNAAEATWESIITGFKDTISDTSLEIAVNLAPIDGLGGILGSAGPNSAKWGSESNYLYAASGTMNFDIADTPGLGTSLNDVILHEMAHVIGIGTLWSSSNVGLPGFQELYVNNSGQYTGAFGVAAYNSEFGQAGSFVPVELGGGPGTANGHWNEVDGGTSPTGITSNITGLDFQQELMTGWLNAPSFISSLTIASMQDLGYNVVSSVPEESGTLLLSIMGVLILSAGHSRRKRKKMAAAPVATN